MPLQATSGAASYDAFGGGVPVEPVYIEQIFSTYLYTGNGSTQTITNGIDLSTKGGLVWLKTRSVSQYHYLFDTARGPLFALSTNATDNSYSIGNTLTAFNSNGFNLGLNSATNGSGDTFVSWTFREQPKFFDIVTYSGNSSTRTISHSLASAPGMIIIKRTTDASDWWSWHRSFSANEYVMLNSTAAKASGANSFISSDSTGFTIGSESNINGSGNSYVAYLFAHDAGGFGLTGTDNVISCGSFTTSSYAATINLGYEPQWLLVKSTSSSGNWFVIDNMRGLTNGSGANFLFPNLSDAESASGSNAVKLLSTGFSLDVGYSPWNGNATNTYIYIAIRRGPMKVPTSGTSVFAPVLGRTANPNYLSGFPVDFAMSEYRVSGSNSTGSRLQGSNQMDTASTGAEASDGSLTWDFMNGYYIGGRTTDFVSWMWRRAPSVCDVVCYTGTGSVQNITHNLTVKPQLIIYKKRSSSTAAWWFVYAEPLGATKTLTLDSNNAEDVYTPTFNDTEPTSTVFTVGTYSGTNASAQTFVAYLFATCAGVSKVGSYTGNGSTQTINCGFTGGARFVLIKRTDSTGDWYVYDTARGMTTLTDPYLLLNSTAAETATLGSVTTVSTGFALNSTILAAINASGGSYIFFAVA